MNGSAGGAKNAAVEFVIVKQVVGIWKEALPISIKKAAF